MIEVTNFAKGLNKYYPPRYLQPEQSRELRDANISRGILESEKAISLANDQVGGFYIANYFADSGYNVWFTHNNPMIYIDFAEQVIKSSANELEKPKKFKSDGTEIGEIGVHNPANKPTLAENTTTESLFYANDIFSYVYTYKKGNAESAPSPAAQIQLQNNKSSIDITTPLATDEGVDAIRIYRAGGGAVEFMFVAEFAGGTFTDDKLSLELGNPLDTWGNEPPPNGLILDCYLKGRLVGHIENEAILRFSNIVNFESWNTLDTINFDSKIMRAIPYAGILVVLCRSEIYQVVGNSIEDVAKAQIPTEQGCVSEYSPIVYNNLLFWQSDDGICVFDGANVQVITQKVFPRSYFNGRKLRSAAKDGIVYFGDENGILALDMNIGNLWREYSSIDGFNTFFYNKADDKLYISTDSSLYTMFTGDESEFLYQSGSYGNDNTLRHFRSIRILGEGKVNVTLYADGEIQREYAEVELDKYSPAVLFYPKYLRAYTTQIRIQGKGKIYSYLIEEYPIGVKHNG